MDQIRSKYRLQSRSLLTNVPNIFDASKDTIFFEDDYLGSCSDDKIPDYQMVEMQRRKRHFDEFKKLYNNKLEEREAKKRAEEEEQQDEFLQHPITKLLSKYGFKVPRSKLSGNSLKSQQFSDCKRSRHKHTEGSRSRSGSLSSGNSTAALQEREVSFSDMEIVDIYQRYANKDLEVQDTHVDLSPLHVEKREDQATNKLREEIAELEDRFNCILKSFKKTFPPQHGAEFTVNSGDDDSQG